MANADNKEDTSQQSNNGLDGKALEAKLADVQEQLKTMNEEFAKSMTSLASRVAPQQKKQETTFSDNDVYDAKTLGQKVEQRSSQIAKEIIAQERQLNNTIYQLSQEYPEIVSDAAIRKAVLEANALLPEQMRDSALGYETAVLKAVSKAGLMPKSKRPVVDEDISSGGGRGSDRNSKKAGKGKVTEDMLAFAQLLGRDVSDPKVIKGLEDAAGRDNWSKYR